MSIERLLKCYIGRQGCLRMINYTCICSRSQKIQILNVYRSSPPPFHDHSLHSQGHLDFPHICIWHLPQIHTHPSGLLPKSRSDTHPRTLSVKSIRLCICAIGIKITPRNWSPNAMARHSAWQSHDNSGSLGCWMLIEANKQISVTWIGHHFQGVQIWVLRRLACYGVGLQGRGNESPVQVAPRELRDGFSSAPRSPLHSHF